MWIVKNVLRGILKFPGLGIEIPPSSEFDLDILSREVSENSNQLKVAFEEEYLQNIKKDPLPQSPVPVIENSNSTGVTDASLEKALSFFKSKIMEEIKQTLPSTLQNVVQEETLASKINNLQTSFAGNMEQLVKSVEDIKDKIRHEKHMILEDKELSSAELTARLKFLEEQEQEISKNFERLGKTSSSSKGTEGNGLMEKADMLSDL